MDVAVGTQDCYGCCCGNPGLLWMLLWEPRIAMDVAVGTQDCYGCCCRNPGLLWVLLWEPRIAMGAAVTQVVTTVLPPNMSRTLFTLKCKGKKGV